MGNASSKQRQSRNIADRQKRIADLAVQTTQLFEYEELLAALVRRQQEIADALDLTANKLSKLETASRGPNRSMKKQANVRDGHLHTFTEPPVFWLTLGDAHVSNILEMKGEKSSHQILPHLNAEDRLPNCC